MTKEEKAEEYAKKSLKGFREYIYLDQAETKIEDAYLAGLHEGQPKWHKYPDKKPEIGTYLVCYQCENGHRETLELEYSYDEEEELHWLDDDCEVFDDKIIAWCEKPVFKE